MLGYWPTLEAQAMQKVLTCLFALSAFAALPAYAANDMISDQAILEMAVQQHVWVKPAEVDARISELRAENALPTPPAGTELRTYIAMQIIREKVRR
jgi:hypothetical protein